MRTPTAYPGRCRACEKRRDVFSTTRLAGGTYRRPPRWYNSSICGPCATGFIAKGAPSSSVTGADKFSLSDLARIVAAIDSDDARTATACYAAKVARRSAEYQEWQQRVAAERVAEAAPDPTAG